MHPVPRGHLLAGADLRTARDRARHPGRPRYAAGHRRRAVRKIVLRLGRRRGDAGEVVDRVLPRRIHRPLRGRLSVRPESEHVRARRSRRRCGVTGPDRQQNPESVTFTIDDRQITVPKGTLIIRAAEQLGIDIPRFCDHPLLDPVAWCRQCMVEVEGQRKPQPSCAVAAAEGMVVRTQHTSAEADRAQNLVMELLLINHPLDCPTCDKGGECPLQNQAMTNGRSETRFEEAKRTWPKPINISSQVLLDRDRCILCARCTRFSDEIAGDKFIEMMDRGALQQVGIYTDTPFDSYFSGNTVQICPVGALTGASYRFRARPFDLVSTPSVCEHCASGCAQRTDHRRGKVMRRMAGDDSDVNEEWNCDKGRWAFTYATQRDRITTPLIRADDGTLTPTSWPNALAVTARALAAARGAAGVLVGGRLTVEDAYGYAKFTRVALGSDEDRKSDG